jgi:hypothetical protein
VTTTRADIPVPVVNEAGETQCEAWALLLTNGEDPGLVDTTGIEDEPAQAADCTQPAAYEVQLDGCVWNDWDYDPWLCVEHTAKIRSLPHGGIIHVADWLP